MFRVMKTTRLPCSHPGNPEAGFLYPRMGALEGPGGGTRNNEAYLRDHVDLEAGLPPVVATLLHDAQTSGGLLLSVPPERLGGLVGDLRDRGIEPAVVGRVLDGPAGRIGVRRRWRRGSASALWQTKGREKCICEQSLGNRSRMRSWSRRRDESCGVDADDGSRFGRLPPRHGAGPGRRPPRPGARLLRQ